MMTTHYWHAVAGLKDGVWARYEVLPQFAFAIGAKFNDTSGVERKFSDMNLIHPKQAEEPNVAGDA